MSSRHLVDPELWPGLEMMPTMGFSEEMLAPTRAMMATMIAARGVVEHPDVLSEERRIMGADGNEIVLMVHRPRAAGSLPAVLHIHGGGYVIGSAAMSAMSNQRTAADAECVVVSVDYRLAPETRHPGPLEDCWAGLRWLHEQADELGVDPARIAVMGESAGGGLAAALALLARDRGGAPIAHQHLIYPMIDDRTGAGDRHPFTGEFVWTPESNRFGWGALLGDAAGGETVADYGAASRAADLSGLPPSYLAVGALDLFVDEDIDYARRLIRAGVPTELHVYPGAFHGFDIAVDATVTKTAYRNSLAALRRALHPG